MMDRTIRAGLVALMCWALSACDPSSGDRELPVVQVDTLGGIVYVRNPPAGSVDTATLLTSIGALGAGGAPQPDEFGRVTSVLLDGQGSVFVADANAAQVREFSREGQFVRSFGRSGQGPGEFTSLYSLGWMGDALLTMEPGKIQVLTTEGAHLESWQWLRFTGSTDYVRIYPTGEREG